MKSRENQRGRKEHERFAMGEKKNSKTQMKQQPENSELDMAEERVS